MTSSPAKGIENMSKRLDPIIEKYKGKKGVTIPLLADVQKELGYVAEEAVDYLAEKADIPAAELFGVATFYAMFRMQPEGKYVVRVCRGTACHVRGSALIGDQIQRHFKIKDGDTTSDGMFTLQYVACLGCCSLAPVMMVGDEVHGRLTPDKAISILESYRDK